MRACGAARRAKSGCVICGVCESVREMVAIEWLERGGGAVCADLLALLPSWFGIPEANENYRRVSSANPTAVAYDNETAVGMLTLIRHSPHAAEISVMAVRPELHRAGIGRRLV